MGNKNNTQHTQALNLHEAWRMLIRIMVDVFIIVATEVKCVLPPFQKKAESSAKEH